MSKGNPLKSPFSEELSSEDVIFLNAMNNASNVLVTAADRLRDMGSHANAEALEVIAEQIIDQLEHSLEEVTSEAESTEDIEPLNEDFSTFDEELAEIYSDYLVWLRGGPSQRGEEAFGTARRFADFLRHDVATHHQLTVRKDVTDEQLIEAARDAYEARKTYRERYR